MSDVSAGGRDDHMRDRASGGLTGGFEASAASNSGIPSAVLRHAGARDRSLGSANDKLIRTT